MRWMIVTGLLFSMVTAWAYSPVPVTPSAAETELQAALSTAGSDSAKLHIAQAALDAHPEDIPLGRAAQDVLFKVMEDPESYFQMRAEGSDSPAAHYLNGRATSDTLVMTREARWLLARNPRSFWGLQLAGDAEWSKEKPDLEQVRQDLEKAVALTRPDPRAI